MAFHVNFIIDQIMSNLIMGNCFAWRRGWCQIYLVCN